MNAERGGGAEPVGPGLPDAPAGCQWERREGALGLRGPDGARLTAEFLRGRTGYRLRAGGAGREPLLQALGKPVGLLVDATAGLGADALTCARAGWRVVAYERAPAMLALLVDGLRRVDEAARADPAGRWAEILARLTPRPGDAREAFTHWGDQPRPEVVYLDPMFPERAKSAQVRAAMRLTRLVAGDGADAGALLDAARTLATRRVVVKRPRNAPPVRPNPAHAHLGRSIRFDIYSPDPTAETVFHTAAGDPEGPCAE